MIRKQYSINSRVLDTLQDIINENMLPINIEVGNSHQEYDGSTLIDVLCEYDDNDIDLVNETICRAINLTLNIIND